MIKNLKTRYSKLLFFKVKVLWMNLSNEGDLWWAGGKGVEIQSLAGSLLCCSLVGDQFQNRTAWENLAGTSREDLILMVTRSAGPEGARTECKHAGNYHDRTHLSEQLSFTPPAHRTTWNPRTSLFSYTVNVTTPKSHINTADMSTEGIESITT